MASNNFMDQRNEKPADPNHLNKRNSIDEEMIGDNDLKSFGTDGISEKMNRNTMDDVPAANPGFGEGRSSSTDEWMQTDRGTDAAYPCANNSEINNESPGSDELPRSGRSLPSDNDYVRSGTAGNRANAESSDENYHHDSDKSAWEKLKDKAENFGDGIKRAFE